MTQNREVPGNEGEGFSGGGRGGEDGHWARRPGR